MPAFQGVSNCAQPVVMVKKLTLRAEDVLDHVTEATFVPQEQPILHSSHALQGDMLRNLEANPWPTAKNVSKAFFAEKPFVTKAHALRRHMEMNSDCPRKSAREIAQQGFSA